jgi:hypothetical protein
MNFLMIMSFLKGIKEIITSTKEFKANMKTISTGASTVPLVVVGESISSAGLVPMDDMQAAVTQLVGAVVFIVLFFIRKSEQVN